MPVCLLCHLEMDDTQLVVHMLETHALFVAVIQSLYFPTTDIFEALIEPMEETYEALTELCEQLGNVELGVSNIDDVTTIIIHDTKSDTCPICLEDMPTECDYIRKINMCQHMFCGFCIETWLKNHKTCPICKCQTSS